jgi:hypothetical protein
LRLEEKHIVAIVRVLGRTHSTQDSLSSGRESECRVGCEVVRWGLGVARLSRRCDQSPRPYPRALAFTFTIYAQSRTHTAASFFPLYNVLYIPSASRCLGWSRAPTPHRVANARSGRMVSRPPQHSPTRTLAHARRPRVIPSLSLHRSTNVTASLAVPSLPIPITKLSRWVVALAHQRPSAAQFLSSLVHVSLLWSISGFGPPPLHLRGFAGPAVMDGKKARKRQTERRIVSMGSA